MTEPVHIHDVEELLHALASDSLESAPPDSWAPELQQHGARLDALLERRPALWLGRVALVARAREGLAGGSPAVEAVLDDILTRADAALVQHHTVLRLHHRAEMGFPWTRLRAMSGDLSELPPRATADAWIGGRLTDEDTAALRSAVRTDPEWQSAYREAIARAADPVCVTRYENLAPSHSRWADRGPELLRVPLPHRGDFLVVRAHHGGTLWQLGSERDLVPAGTTAHTWGDAILGALVTTFEEQAADPLAEAYFAARWAQDTASEPDEACVEVLLSALHAWLPYLSDAAQRVLEGQRTTRWAADDGQALPVAVRDRLTTPEGLTPLPAASDETLKRWVLALVDLRMALDAPIASLDDPHLDAKIAAVDADFEAAEAGVLLATRDDIEALVPAGDFLDPHTWWGVHARGNIYLVEGALFVAGDEE